MLECACLVTVSLEGNISRLKTSFGVEKWNLLFGLRLGGIWLGAVIFAHGN